MKSFLARLWVPFHCEGLVYANFWDPNEHLQQDIPKTTCRWGAVPGPASLRGMPGGLCQQASLAQGGSEGQLCLLCSPFANGL